MTKRETIRECKRLWKAIKKSGLSKEDFLHSEEGGKWLVKDYLFDCPLCSYAANGELLESDSSQCVERCPLQRQYGRGCFDLDFIPESAPSPKWLSYIEGLKE